ncbi:MAG: substrate-binding domain-containing protein, partial [Capsulimonas sp.]|uniref:LacI family DNA-binding transcriptional regulator n=1 Tax=Capsulimonas sp. TaxID=2494211 RepID=UPI0032645275
GLLADGALRADGGRGTFVGNAGDAARADQTPKSVAPRMIALIYDQSFNPTDLGAQSIPRAIYHKFLAEEANCRLLTFDTHGDTPERIVELEAHALDAVEAEGVAGVIIWHSGGETTLPQIRRIMDRGVPVIFMDRYPAALDCDFVGVDDECSGQEATEYLLSLGHRRIAFLAPLENITTIDQRFSGYKRALNMAGIVPASELICRPPYTLSLNIVTLKEQLQLAAASLAALEEPPTAVFAVNDLLAHYYVAAAKEIGLSVPQDISVIGFDDMDRYSPSPQFLTTMRQPFEIMGERTAELLLKRLMAPEQRTYQHILLPTKLIVRQSCRSR